MIPCRQTVFEVDQRQDHDDVQYPKNAAPIKDGGQSACQRNADDKRQGVARDQKSHGTAKSFFGRKGYYRRNGQYAIAVGANPRDEPDDEQQPKALRKNKRHCHQDRYQQHQLQHPDTLDFPQYDQDHGNTECGAIRIHGIQQAGIGDGNVQRSGDLIQNTVKHKG